MPLFETVTDLHDGADVLRRRAYGVIEAAGGRFRRVVLRPFPKVISVPEILVLGGWYHGRRPGDRCLLYYNQPWRFPNFLAVKYVISARGTSYKTMLRTLDALDEIARLKRSDALLCDVANWRVSPKMMARRGWEPHCPSRWHRHYIKRFYGQYPPPAAWIASSGEPRVEVTSVSASDTTPEWPVLTGTNHGLYISGFRETRADSVVRAASARLDLREVSET